MRKIYISNFSGLTNRLEALVNGFLIAYADVPAIFATLASGRAPLIDWP